MQHPAPRPTAPRWLHRSLAAPALALAALLCAPGAAHSADNAPAASTANTDTAASYKEVVLRDLVEKSRTDIAGQRIIFAPTAVKFRARLSAMPAPQKADYLMSALAMMRVSSPPKVSQRIGLDYGGDKGLAAYIDDGAAERLGRSAQPGQILTFYAFHVYNNNRGPALVVTAFSE
ncbi:MAG: hypothetical protein ACT4NV_12300 [Rhodoferax sp.]